METPGNGDMQTVGGYNSQVEDPVHYLCCGLFLFDIPRRLLTRGHPEEEQMPQLISPGTFSFILNAWGGRFGINSFLVYFFKIWETSH